MPKGQPKPKPYPPVPLHSDEVVVGFTKFRGQTVMQEALANLGLTPDRAASALMEELAASTTKGQIIDGRWVYSRPSPVWEVRQKARQDLTRYWGAYKGPDDRDGESGPLVVEIRDFSDKVDVTQDKGADEE